MIRDDLVKLIEENRNWVKRMSDGYASTGWNSSEYIADKVLEKFNLDHRVK